MTKPFTALAMTAATLLATSLLALPAMAVNDGVDISAAVKTFNGKPFAHLKHADV